MDKNSLAAVIIDKRRMEMREFAVPSPRASLLEVVEAIVSDDRLIVILTDEDVLQRRDAPLKGVFYRLVLPVAPATMNVKGEAFGLIRESLKFTEDVTGLEKLAREIGR